MRVAEYGPSRRADVADLMARVWGRRPAEAELEWFYERNPVRPASVLLGEEDGRVVGSVAISYQPLGGGVVGFAVHLATDPDYRGRGIFSGLEAEGEARAREAGVRLLLTVPTPASARILTERLGWERLPPLRLWARPWLPLPPRQARMECYGDAWRDWRFAEAPREYTLLADGTVLGRRGRFGFVAKGGPATAGGLATIALPAPHAAARYLLAGFAPTPSRFTLLGKSLDGSPLPQRPPLELGDLDFL